MANNFSPEQIEATILINSERAIDQLKALTKEASGLSSKLKTLTPDTQDFIDTSASLSKVNTQILELQKSMDLTAMSQRQLTAELKQLIAIQSTSLPGTAKYTELGVEIGKVKDRLQELKAVSADASSPLEKFSETIKGVGVGLVAAFSFEKIKGFFTESETAFETEQMSVNELTHAMGSQAESIIALGNYLAQHTHFLKSDILAAEAHLTIYTKEEDKIKTLMPLIVDLAQVKQINLKRATDLVGKSLEGNLLSMTELGLSTKKTGSEQERYAAIVADLTNKVKGQAEAALTGIEASNKLAKATENVTVQTGRLLEQATSKDKEFIAQMFNDIAESMKPLEESAADSTEAFFQQQQQFDDIKKTVPPLLDQYDALSGKAKSLGGTSKLSKDEQEKLKSIIEQVGGVLPEAATGFDKYGKAIDISTEAGRKWIVQQENIMAVKNEDQIKKQSEALTDLNEQLKKENSNYSLGAEGWKKKTVEYMATAPGVTVEQEKWVDANNDELKAHQANIAALQAKKDGVQGYINELKGIPPVQQQVTASNDANVETLQKLLDKQKSLNDELKTTELNSKRYWDIQNELKTLNEKIAKAENPFKEAAKDADELTKKIKQLTEEAYQSSLSADSKELEAIRHKYDEAYALAKGNKIAIAQLNELYNTEIANKESEQFEKRKKKEYKDSLTSSQEYWDNQNTLALQQLQKGEITEEQFNDKKLENTVLMYKDMQAWAADYGITDKELQEKLLNAQIALAKQKAKELQDTWKITWEGMTRKQQEEWLKMEIATGKGTAEMIKQLNELYKKDEEDFKKSATAKEKITIMVMEETKKAVEYGFQFLGDVYKKDEANLKKQKDNNLISEQDYQTQLAAIKKKEAVAKKIESMFEIAIKEAEAVFKLQAIAAVQLSDPITAPLAANTYTQMGITIGEAAAEEGIVAAEPIAYAQGAIVTRPTLGLVGEDGDEAMIPLDAGKRSRGIDLWLEAGKRMDIPFLSKQPSAINTTAIMHSYQPNNPAYTSSSTASGSNSDAPVQSSTAAAPTDNDTNRLLHDQIKRLNDHLDNGIEANLNNDLFLRHIHRQSDIRKAAGVNSIFPFDKP